MKNKKIKKQKLNDRFPFLEMKQHILFCEVCNLSVKDVKVKFSKKFKCWMCTACYKERLGENTGEYIDPNWWK